MSKHRITISLSETTVKKVDQLIDKRKIRNRSHAIEHLIQMSLQPVVGTAVILAGEKEPTKDRVRPLTPLDGKPLIFYTLELLQKYGVQRVIILTSKFGSKIETVVGDGEQWGMDILYIYESKPLGTAGAIKQAEPLIGKVPFFVIAGDVWTTIDLSDLVSFHQDLGGVMTMAVKPRPAQAAYDSVFVQGNMVVDFQHNTTDQVIGIVNSGVYVCEPELFSFIPDKSPSSLEDDVFPELAKQHKLNAFTFQGIWYDISLDENYKQVLEKMRGSSSKQLDGAY